MSSVISLWPWPVFWRMHPFTGLYIMIFCHGAGQLTCQEGSKTQTWLVVDVLLCSCIAFLCPCHAPITVAHLAPSVPTGALHVHSGQIKHGRAGPAGRVLKGIAPRVVPIPHLGIRSRGLKSHLLLTHALPSSCSVSQACSVFFLFALAWHSHIIVW